MKKILNKELNKECKTISEKNAKIIAKRETFPHCPCGKLDCEFSSDFFPNASSSATNAAAQESLLAFSTEPEDFYDFSDGFSNGNGAIKRASEKEQKESINGKSNDEKGKTTNKNDDSDSQNGKIVYRDTAIYKMIDPNNDAFSTSES